MIYEQKETGTTPAIRFDIEENSFAIEGRSLAENAKEFYGNLVNWIDENLNSRQTKASVEIKLDYCNTSSYKGLALVLHKLGELNAQGSSFVVNKWVYKEGDEDWLEDGRNFQEIVDVPFEFESFEAPPLQES